MGSPKVLRVRERARVFCACVCACLCLNVVCVSTCLSKYVRVRILYGVYVCSCQQFQFLQLWSRFKLQWRRRRISGDRVGVTLLDGH